MKSQLIEQIHQQNPWLRNPNAPYFDIAAFHPRVQTSMLLEPEWDDLCTLLIGPRRAGKTTLALHLSEQLIKQQQRYKNLLYLNCDYFDLRQWLATPLFINEAIKTFQLDKPIILIDEVQRLANPGLLLKAIIDLKLPIKLMATGSSQLEIRSKVKEHLTGRNFTSLVLPLSFEEIQNNPNEKYLLYGCYPQVVNGEHKQLILENLYDDYINKDIIEILKLNQPDSFRKLLTLLAHSSGQLINYNQLANDCGVSHTLIRNYLSVMEQTFVCNSIKPFVGNKRKEVTSNPIYYFIDNGFRNRALNNFNSLEQRTDLGLLIEGAVYQALLKFKTQHFLEFQIHYWRTASGAEVDFVLYKNDETIIPIEIKYRNMNSIKITRSFRSFIQAYQPNIGYVVTKDLVGETTIDSCRIHFLPFSQLKNLISALRQYLS